MKKRALSLAIAGMFTKAMNMAGKTMIKTLFMIQVALGWRYRKSLLMSQLEIKSSDAQKATRREATL